MAMGLGRQVVFGECLGINTCGRQGKEAGVGRGRSHTSKEPKDSLASPHRKYGELEESFCEIGTSLCTLAAISCWLWPWLGLG